MESDKLIIYSKAKFKKPRLLLGFSGWMNGGDVSTGTLNWLILQLQAKVLAEIDPEGFYIYNFPGPMETTSMFRPYAEISDGLIKSYDIPRNTFFYDEASDLILFLGKEPNMNWGEFANCIFELCQEFGVKSIFFIGSVAGLVPHTREARISCSASDSKTKQQLGSHGFDFTEYQGPASFVTHLTAGCIGEGISMANLMVTVPAYVRGENPICIETVVRNIGAILGLHFDLDELRDMSDDFERRLSDAVQDVPELASNISKLEEIYDKDMFDHELGDLKTWLEKRGVSLE